MLTPQIHQGDLTAKPGEAYDFTEITGGLYASGADTRTAFPKLTTVGGGLYASGADTRTAFPKLTTVGGGLDARGADTRTAFRPDCRFNAGHPAPESVRSAVTAAFAKHGLALNDGILAHIVASKGAVKRVRIVGQTRISYIVERDGKTAHGNTLAEARADLLVKLGNRDTTPYKAWTRETEASLQDMIVAYRVITGACGAGVSHFLASRSLPAKFTVARAIDETRGQYGGDTFAAFFANN